MATSMTQTHNSFIIFPLILYMSKGKLSLSASYGCKLYINVPNPGIAAFQNWLDMLLCQQKMDPYNVITLFKPSHYPITYSTSLARKQIWDTMDWRRRPCCTKTWHNWGDYIGVSTFESTWYLGFQSSPYLTPYLWSALFIPITSHVAFIWAESKIHMSGNNQKFSSRWQVVVSALWSL